MNKLLVGVLAASAIGAVPASAPAQFDNRTTTTLVAMLLASQMGVDPNLMLALALGGSNGIPVYEGGPYYSVAPYTETVYDLAPVFVIERLAPRRRPYEILLRRRQGWSWVRISDWAGVPRARYNQYYALNEFNPNYWGETVTRRRLYVPASTIVVLRQRGMNWNDVALATVTSRQARQPILVVADNWRRQRNWNRVATSYRIQPAVIRTQLAQFRTTRKVPTVWRTVNNNTVNRTVINKTTIYNNKRRTGTTTHKTTINSTTRRTGNNNMHKTTVNGNTRRTVIKNPSGTHTIIKRKTTTNKGGNVKHTTVTHTFVKAKSNHAMVGHNSNTKVHAVNKNKGNNGHPAPKKKDKKAHGGG